MHKHKTIRTAMVGAIFFCYPLMPAVASQSVVIPRLFLSSELFHDTEHILGKLHSTFVLEVAESRLVPWKSQNQRIRWIAKKMIKDYNDADQKVIAQAARINAPLRDFVPEDLPEAIEQQRSQDAKTHLENDEGPEFDFDFLNTSLEDHKNEISWLRANENKLDPYNRGFVHQQIALLQQNYMLLQQLRKQWPTLQ